MSRAVNAIIDLMSAIVIRALGVVAVGLGVDEAFGVADTSGSCSSAVLRSSFGSDPRVVPRFDLTKSDMLFLS